MFGYSESTALEFDKALGNHIAEAHGKFQSDTVAI